VIAKDQSGAVVVSDYFSSSTLDSTKWATCELVREISAEKLRSKVRSSLATTSPVYNSLDFLYPSTIDFIQANVTPLSYQNNEGALPVARIAGTYYNDGTGTGIPGDRTGDVSAQVLIGGRTTSGLVIVSSTDSAGEVPVTSFGTLLPYYLEQCLHLSPVGMEAVTFRSITRGRHTPAITINPGCSLKAIGLELMLRKEATIEALLMIVVYYGPLPRPPWSL
jgi:hypothetical protein